MSAAKKPLLKGWNALLQPNGALFQPKKAPLQPNGASFQPNGAAPQPNGAPFQPKDGAPEPNGALLQPNGAPLLGWKRALFWKRALPRRPNMALAGRHVAFWPSFGAITRPVQDLGVQSIGVPHSGHLGGALRPLRSYLQFAQRPLTGRLLTKTFPCAPPIANEWKTKHAKANTIQRYQPSHAHPIANRPEARLPAYAFQVQDGMR